MPKPRPASLWSRVRRALRVPTWLVLVLVVLVELRMVPGFLPAPALLEAPQPSESLEAFPAGAQRAEALLPDGQRLRGVFVPSDPGAPVVLHLLESSGCALTERFGYHGLVRALSDLGFASLMLDYRGVGLSDGSRSTRNLEEDALAMWEAALERAHGDSSLVLIRGVSIGTLAAALLAQHGVEPAAWILVDALRPETVVENFARDRWGAVAARLASPFFEPLVDAPTEAFLRRVRAPLHVRCARRDRFVTTAEQESLRALAEGVGGEWRWYDGTHELAAWDARGVPDRDEIAFVRRMVSDWPDVEARTQRVLTSLADELRARLGDAPSSLAHLRALAVWSLHGEPRDLAMAALAGVDDPFRFLEQPRRFACPVGDSFDDCFEQLRLDDPAGAIPAQIVDSSDLRILGRSNIWSLVDCPAEWPGVMNLVRAIESAGLHDRPSVELALAERGVLSLDLECPQWLRASGFFDALPLRDARRRLARGVFKALRLRERVVVDSEGETQLEVFDVGVWKRVDLDWASDPSALAR